MAEISAPNIEITDYEMKVIQSLPPLDITMFLSEIDDFGWAIARKLLPTIERSLAKHGQGKRVEG